MTPLLNKTMDRDDLDAPAARAVAGELDRLIERLRARGLRVSSWYGFFDLPGDPDSMERVNRGYGYEPLEDAVDDHRFPWFLYWEIAWLTINNEYRPGQRLLDLGGCSSLFSLYMASKGLDVVAVDLDRDLVANGDEVAAATGWRLRNRRMDIRELEVAERFDHVASVCVFEHLPIHGRMQTSTRIRDVLVDGGSFSLTFDYRNPSRRARIDSPADVEEQFVRPSGLRIRGNREFHDNGKRYLLHPAHHPVAARAGWRERCVEQGQFDAEEAGRVSDANEYTFGALFLRR
ncbi:MAG: class I SAM-dependent methyltransferase [Actinomycetota bacterium]|nr:class I SAM-dependent methyltransferase [Actinomycetota bacterium]